MSEFAGTTALVTGGGNGIGRALSELLAREGARVAVTDVDAKSARAVAEAIVSAGGAAKAFGLDVTNAEQWANVVAEVEQALGPVELLCSNAGVAGCLRELTETPAAYFRWLFDVNVLGSLHAIHTIVPGMKARKRGKVLFTGSMSGLWTASPAGDYCVSKHAVLALADTLRQELKTDGIQVSLLCPAGVQTGLEETSRNLSQANTGSLPSELTPEATVSLMQMCEETGGMASAEAVARMALDGLRAGRFFIFTHRQSIQRALDRNDEIVRELRLMG